MPKENDIGQAARDNTGWRWAERAPQRFKGHEELLVDATSTGFQDIPDGADSVRLRVETGDVRWLADGDDPTTGVGELFKTTDPVLVLENIGFEELFLFRFITTGGSATVHVLYYRVRA